MCCGMRIAIIYSVKNLRGIVYDKDGATGARGLSTLAREESFRFFSSSRSVNRSDHGT